MNDFARHRTLTATTRNQGNHASQEILTLITLSAGSRGTLAAICKTFLKFKPKQ